MMVSNKAVICPKYMSSGIKIPTYACDQNRYSTYSSAVSVKKSDATPMTDFMNTLEREKNKILYVGDSLTKQMYDSLLCTLESEGYNKDPRGRYVDDLFWTSFLAPITEGYRIQTDENISSTHLGLDWWRNAIDGNFTHVVLNTGAWWYFARFDIYNGKKWSAMRSDQEALAMFRAHWDEQGHLMKLLSLLRSHNIEIIWREIAPTGMCPITNHALSYIFIFPEMNRIAAKAMETIGGHVIPGVWDHSAPLFKQHRSVTQDQLHWCLFREDSVPAYWNLLLANTSIFRRKK
jgi:hypothetical protein